jgi:glycosyltransferase involved in cell wall biosynthesis
VAGTTIALAAADKGAAGLNPRLVLLAAYGGPYEGSFIPMTRALADVALAAGWRVELAFWPGAERRPWYQRLERETPAEVGVASGGGRRATATWIARRLEKDARPTIVHTHFTRFDLPAVLAARGHPDATVIWHVHTPLYRGARAFARGAAKYGVVGRSVDAILASGEEPAAGVLRCGAPRDRVTVVGSGVDTARFHPATPSDRSTARRELGLPQEASVLLHFGWDWDLKGGDLFVATVRALAQGGEDVLGVTVTDTTEGRRAVERAGLGDRLRVIAPRDEVATLYGSADLFLSSSRVEGEPFAVIEALCSGLPVVATDLPGHRGVCGGLDSCRLADRDPAALARGVVELRSRDESEAQRTALRARERTVERFDLQPWARRMLHHYRKCMTT